MNWRHLTATQHIAHNSLDLCLGGQSQEYGICGNSFPLYNSNMLVFLAPQSCLASLQAVSRVPVASRCGLYPDLGSDGSYHPPVQDIHGILRSQRGPAGLMPNIQDRAEESQIWSAILWLLDDTCPARPQIKS